MKGLLFTYGLCCGGTVIALFNPFVGLLIYVAFSILKPDILWFWSVPAGNYSQLVAIALLIGWVLNGFSSWRFGWGRGVVFALLGFWLWSAISAGFAADQVVAWKYVEAISKITLPFLVGITTIDSVRKLKQLAWVIVLSHGYLALEFNQQYYQGVNVLWESGFAGMDNNSVGIALVTCIGLSFFLGLHSERWWHKALAFGAACLMAHAVMFSYSRGGMLALCISGVVAFLLVRKQRKHYLLFGLVALLLLRMAGPEVRQRFMTVFTDPSKRDAAAQTRLDLWTDCWQVMLQHPILGAGPDHWPLVAHEFGWPRGKEAHSLWLQTGAELGFPGLACLALFYGLCIARLWRITRSGEEHSEPWMLYLAQMVITSLIGFAVSAQFVSLEALEVPYYIALIGAGVLKFSAPRPPFLWRLSVVLPITAPRFRLPFTKRALIGLAGYGT